MGEGCRAGGPRRVVDGSSGGLIGRAEQLAAVRARLASGGPILIRGVAGVGKTALLDAALAGRSGDLRIRGVAALATVPYLPLRTALPDLTVASPMTTATAVERLLARGGALVVDDLHWCDHDTLSVIADVAVTRTVVGAVRPQAGRAAELVDQFEAWGAVIELDVLGDDDAAALIRQVRPAAPDRDIARCVLGGGGRPFDLALLARSSGDATDDGEPAGAALAALAAIEPRLVELMAAVAIAGAPVEVDLADRDVLIAHSLITVGEDGRCEARHDLLAQAAIASVEPRRLQHLHRVAALASADPAIRALHLAAAGDHRVAVEAAAQAAAAAPTVSSRADFLTIVADHARPRSPEAELAAAEALSLTGRYREAVELLGRGRDDAVGPTGRHHLIRARSHWAVSDIDAARADIEAGLALDELDQAIAAELHSLRSRIRCRVDWDLPGAINDGRTAVELAGDSGSGAVAAHSALGLAHLMAGDPAWQGELAAAGRAAATDHDVHNAVTLYDTQFFAHLLSGDSAQCGPLAAEMVAFTEHRSRPWNGYFRAVSLLARLHVDGDHRAVVREAEHLAGRRLTVKSAEALRSAHALALVDSGLELDAVEVAEDALAWASDASARSMASWSLAEALWLAGDAERAAAVADAALELGLDGFPGVVNAALAGLWAKRELGRPLDAPSIDATRSPFANLLPASIEAGAILESTRDPAVAVGAFHSAAVAWKGLSRRSAPRAMWGAGVAAFDAGDTEQALQHLHAAEQAATELGIPWLERRINATLRHAGATSSSRVAASTRRARSWPGWHAGQTSAMIARSLAIKPSTVESHIRQQMLRTGARTRLQAAAHATIGGRDDRLRFVVTRDADGRMSIRGGRRSVLSDASGAAPRWPLERVPPHPWNLPPGACATGAVRSYDDVAVALMAALRGATLAITVPARLGLLGATILDELGRAGVVEERATPDDVAAPLDDLELRLVALVAAGATVTQAAAEVGYSRREVQRRLAALRERTGANSNAAAVMSLAEEVASA